MKKNNRFIREKKNISKRVMFLYGKNSVRERLKKNPLTIRKIFLKSGFRDDKIFQLIRDNNVDSEIVSPNELLRIKRVENSQGVLAKVQAFDCEDIDDILNQDTKTKLIFLDSVFDPVNVGAVIRICACLGGFILVIPKHNACDITETVLHIASGGENYVPIVKVTNIITALRKAKEKGYWIMGAVADGAAQSLATVKLPYPLGIVLGSEGKGIRPGIRKLLDLSVCIPMNGAALSLNLNTACAIICYEIMKGEHA